MGWAIEGRTLCSPICDWKVNERESKGHTIWNTKGLAEAKSLEDVNKCL